MNDISWEKLSDKEYRDAFSEGLVDDRLSAQIYYLRKHRGWTQKELAERSGLSQPTISGLEETTEGARLGTLRKIASAFDVAVDARFISFGGLLAAFDKVPLNDNVPSFSEEHQTKRVFELVKISFPSDVNPPVAETRARTASRMLLNFSGIAASGNERVNYG